MKRSVVGEHKAASKILFNPPSANLLQRKCSCGQPANLTGKCQDCERSHLSLQQKSVNEKAATSNVPPIVHDVLQSATTISPPNNSYEQEADRIASQAIQSNRTFTPLRFQITPLRPSAIANRKTTSTPPSAVPGTDITQQLQQTQGNGKPMADSVRQPLENAFGVDFSNVQIHTHTQADELNQTLQAKAFTTGQDIYFRQGAYAPESSSGRELLAHELTHVVQQSGQKYQIQTRLERQEPSIHNPLSAGFLCTWQALDYADQFSRDVTSRIEYDDEVRIWNRNNGLSQGDWGQALYDAWGHCYIAACLTRESSEVAAWSLGSLYEVSHEIIAQVGRSFFWDHFPIVGDSFTHDSINQDTYNQAVGRSLGMQHSEGGDLYEICFDAMMAGRLDLTLAGIPRGRPLHRRN